MQAALLRQSLHSFTPLPFDNSAKFHAELATIRAEGHALDREEHEPGIICCAALILTKIGSDWGAISVTSTTARSSLDHLSLQSERIEATTKRIATEAENGQFPE